MSNQPETPPPDLNASMPAQANEFVQALANVCDRPVEVSPVRDATAVGAALLGFGRLKDPADQEEGRPEDVAIEEDADLDSVVAQRSPESQTTPETKTATAEV